MWIKFCLKALFVESDNLRGDLNLLLLDSSFTIKKRYTIFDHMMYLFHLQQKSPKRILRKGGEFHFKAATRKMGIQGGINHVFHVYSSDTAAGDEIGWMYVHQVLNSKTTFSGFCKSMTSTYIRRFPKSRSFMDPGVFLKWWFSWASNMHIDFRKPCEVCKFTPHQLACDGTKIGIGFRNAVFEPIEKPSEPAVYQTLHRRLDRCFLKSSVDISAENMKVCREHLFFLANKVFGEEKQIAEANLDEDTVIARTDFLQTVLPEDVKDSFERFLVGNMPDVEKIAYAKLLIMLSTTAPLSTIIPKCIVSSLDELLVYISSNNPDENGDRYFNAAMQNLRFYCPEVRDLIANSMYCNQNENLLPQDIVKFIKYILTCVDSFVSFPPEEAVEQIGTYNPAKYGRAYYFTPSGNALRNIRKFTIDEGKAARNTEADDHPNMSFET
ncbi:uncharacterized protein [Argopecten irradians]|uniref:uncharacterized protein n=1 Tax=Argopecten irradians TaxID=31199 RepID=UPI00371D5CEB